LPEEINIKKAGIFITADIEDYVFVNGHRAGQNKNWQQTSLYNIKSHLYPGENVVCVKAVNEGTEPDPAGLIGKIIIIDSSNRVIQIPIDKSWKCSDTRPKGWRSSTFDDNNWKSSVKIANYNDALWGHFNYENKFDLQFRPS